MNDFKIAVFISGNGTNLQSLIDTKFLNNHNFNLDKNNQFG